MAPLYNCNHSRRGTYSRNDCKSSDLLHARYHRRKGLHSANTRLPFCPPVLRHCVGPYSEDSMLSYQQSPALYSTPMGIQSYHQPMTSQQPYAQPHSKPKPLHDPMVVRRFLLVRTCRFQVIREANTPLESCKAFPACNRLGMVHPSNAGVRR